MVKVVLPLRLFNMAAVVVEVAQSSNSISLGQAVVVTLKLELMILTSAVLTQLCKGLSPK